MLLAIGFVVVHLAGIAVGYRIGSGSWLPSVSIDLSGGD